jgi:hypothetical protein
MESILEQVQGALAARKGEWREIADDLGYSYEFISRLGLRSYESSPTIGRLERIAQYLRSKPKKKRAA